MISQYWTFHQTILTIQYQSPPKIIWNGFGIFSILKYTAAVNNVFWYIYGYIHSLHVSCYIVWIYHFLQERAVKVAPYHIYYFYAPYTLVQYLYRSVSNFRRPANVLKYSDHEKLFFEAFLRRNCQVFCS